MDTQKVDAVFALYTIRTKEALLDVVPAIPDVLYEDHYLEMDGYRRRYLVGYLQDFELDAFLACRAGYEFALKQSFRQLLLSNSDQLFDCANSDEMFNLLDQDIRRDVERLEQEFRALVHECV